MTSALVTTSELYEWAECKQPAKLIAWMNENNIPYRLSRKGKPITTVDAINGSLKTEQQDEIDF